MSSSSDRTESVFAEAVAIESPRAREAYLAEACAADPALRERVDALLRAHGRADHLLDRPAVEDLTVTAIGGELPGVVVAGRYKLLESIGEGGMGTVWLAEQFEPVRRKVALKLIKAGMDSKSVLARFDAERQALAVMDHPNIAKVLDGGLTEMGRPFFAMEYVKGVPITDYCDAARLSVRDRLKLFVTVCQAVQHAHQKGIIHRDLKPSNVLVAQYDGKPVPKVIDFGLAKAVHQSLTDRTLHTAHDSVLGTPLYMSPEQAELNNLDVDTRSDIYSLGVVLYELLTGTTPLERQRFKQAAWDEVRRIIREEEPPRPSTRLSSTDALPSLAAGRGMEAHRLTNLVRGELDWIVMKALEKDRGRRYETANGFASDVDRYLTGEPVIAAPPSATYRLRKLARKYRAPLATAIAMVSLLIAGTVVSTWQAFRASRAEAAAVIARDAEKAQRQIAVTAAEQASAERDTARQRTAEREAVINFVSRRVFSAPGNRPEHGGLGRNVTMREALVASLPFLESGLADQPLAEAQLRLMLGICFSDLGDYRLAADQEERAVALLTKTKGADLQVVIRATNNLALDYGLLGRRADALNLQEDALKRASTGFGPDHPLTRMCLSNLANSYADAGRYAEVLPLREKVLSLMRVQFGADSPKVVPAMLNLASALRDVGRDDDSANLNVETIALSKSTLGADHPDTLRAMYNLSLNYLKLNRKPEAIAIAEQVFSLRKARLGPDDPDTLASMNQLAACYDTVGRYADGLALREEGLSRSRAKFGSDNPDTTEAMSGLARSYDSVGRHEDALKLREETLTRRKAMFGPNDPDTLRAMHGLAYSLDKVGRHDEADALRIRRLEIKLAKFKQDDPAALPVQSDLAQLLATSHDVKLRDSNRALQLALKTTAADPASADYRGALGMVRYSAGDFKNAIADLEAAVKLRKPDDSANAAEGFVLAMAYWQSDDKEKARQWWDRSVAWMDKAGDDKEEYEEARDQASQLLRIKADKH